MATAAGGQDKAATGNSTPTSESSMCAQEEVGVLYIRADPVEWRYSTGTVYLSDLDGPRNMDIDADRCNDIEKALGSIPHPDQLDDFRRDFHWKYRTLVKVRDLEAGKKDGVERADYLMYVCLDERSGEQRNGYLEKLVSGAVKLYGSAFVFKKTTESGEWSDPDEAVYLNNRDRSDEFEMGMENTEFHERILKKLMEAVCQHSSANQSAESPPQ